jgi:ParB family transcriptional regulator, chromosome partitioning protein
MAKKKARRASANELAPEQVGVKTLKLDELRANPHNPRVLFDKAPMETLKASIDKVGILVPLTVYFDSKRKHYVILDGQRRWICAQELNLSKIPVNQVSEPTLVQNIVTMFQIHKLREDWELMPSALKLQLLMEELDERNDRQLASLTGLDLAVVQRCKKLLTYPKKYQDLMLDPDPSKRVKADFFIELYVVRTDRLVNTFEWFKKDQFTKDMLNRYQTGKLRSVTDFRKIKQHINNARLAGEERQISRRLKEFSADADLPIEHLEISSASVTAEASAIRKQTDKLFSDIEKLDVDSFLGENELWESLERLSKAIRRKLIAAGRRLRG